MGSGKLKAAVTDSGPLIHLSEIGCLPFLFIFDSLYIPHAVLLETVGRNRMTEKDLLSQTHAQKLSAAPSKIEQFVKDNNLTELHAGEQECLFHCRQKKIGTLLTDDMAVRNAARLLNLVPVGSLGIVIAAFKREIVSSHEAERHIANLYDVSSLFVTRDMVGLAIHELRTHIKTEL